MGKKANNVIRIEIDPEKFNRLRKKMGPEELAGYMNYTKKSAHVFKDRTKYDRKKAKRELRQEKWK